LLVFHDVAVAAIPNIPYRHVFFSVFSLCSTSPFSPLFILFTFRLILFHF
jgi:hypothetical protein